MFPLISMMFKSRKPSLEIFDKEGTSLIRHMMSNTPMIPLSKQCKNKGTLLGPLNLLRSKFALVNTHLAMETLSPRRSLLSIDSTQSKNLHCHHRSQLLLWRRSKPSMCSMQQIQHMLLSLMNLVMLSTRMLTSMWMPFPQAVFDQLVLLTQQDHVQYVINLDIHSMTALCCKMLTFFVNIIYNSSSFGRNKLLQLQPLINCKL